MHNTSKKNTETFIEEARKVHGDKYDYSKVEYVNNITKVCIICPIHGEFWQIPKSHLCGKGCKKCALEKNSEYRKKHLIKTNGVKKIFNTETFIEEARKVHGDKYDYSKVEYTNRDGLVTIICPEHGEFKQRASNHIHNESKCPECNKMLKRIKFSLTTEEFIEKANNIFHNLYSYQNVRYINNSTKVYITCEKHGDFLCTPLNHLHGRGCPICKAEIYVYENKLYVLLNFYFPNEEIIRQFKSPWLTNNKSIDFFFPKYQIAIEHQGSQHFKPIYFLGGEKKFSRTKELDIEKYNECQENNIEILYFSYEKYVDFSDFFSKVYTNEEEIINLIKNIINEKSNRN